MPIPSFRALVLAALLLPSAALAATGSWSDALPADAVASHFEGSKLRVVVVPAGTGATDAAAALSASVRKAPSVQVAMGSESLGDVSSLDDAAIVAKAKALPVDLVAVVRVFDGKEGAKSAVVTLYTPQGATVSAFSAGTDAPLAAKNTAGAGVGGTAGAVLGDVLAGTNADRETRIKQFEERGIWMQGYAAVDSSSGRVVSTWSVPMKGKYGEALVGREFYEYVGKPDLAALYKKRQTTRNIIAASSAVVLAGGAAYWGLSLQETAATYKGQGSPCWEFLDQDYNATDEFRSCKKEIDAHNAAVTLVGGSLVGVGSVGLMVPLFMSPHPIKPNERSRLVDEYNQALVKELGLSARADAPVEPRVAASAWAGPDGGGVTLAGEF